MLGRFSRAELIEMVRRIVALEGSEREIHARLALFMESVPYPGASDLIFHQDPELTPEEIVDRALAYQAIPLGPGIGLSSAAEMESTVARGDARRVLLLPRAGRVSVWVGSFSNAELNAYLHEGPTPRFPEAASAMSPFAFDLAIATYDHDRVEVGRADGPAPLRQLLATLSHSASFAHAVPGAVEGNTAIAIYDHEYEPVAADSCGLVRFVGAFPYDDTAPSLREPAWFEGFRTLGFVSVWCGDFDADDLGRYLAERDNDTAAISDFGAEIGLGWYDHDFLEVVRTPEPTNVSTLLGQASFSSSFAASVRRTLGAADGQVNTLFFLYDYRHHPPRATAPGDRLRFLGAHWFDPLMPAITHNP